MARHILGVLLAAGTGSRLRPLTENLPKCLLEVGGRPLLDYQLEALAVHGVEDLLIVTGHAADQITRRYPRLRALHDPEFAATNNLHSLWAARREFAGRDFVCLHTDLLFHPAILRPCLESRADVGVVLDRALVEETLKARVEGDRVVEISKSIPPAKMFGTFLGIARFSARAAAVLPDVLGSLVAREENRQAYFTACLPALAARAFPATFTLTEGFPWVEVDSPADLQHASERVLPLLPPTPKGV